MNESWQHDEGRARFVSEAIYLTFEMIHSRSLSEFL